MAQRGRLVDWNDERGFGFLATEDGQRVFLHISAIRGAGRRPQQGDEMRFVPGFSSDGRLVARSVHFMNATLKAAGPRGQGGRRGIAYDWRQAAFCILASLVAGGVALDRLPQAMALAYLVVGIVSLILYRSDKSFAETGRWRISEATLLGVDLCFGIAGGLLAQALFRHKTRKPRYVLATGLILAVHLLWLGSFITGILDPRLAWNDIATALRRLA